MPNKRTGKYVNCKFCGTEYYRSYSDIHTYNKHQTCGASECKTKNMSGKNNPFWGKRHSKETRKKIRENRAKNPPKKTGPKKGGFVHTEEAKKKISEASKRLWKEKREKMLASLPRGKDHVFHKDPSQRRYRQNFTPVQRREWKDDKCAFCDSTESLELDHIIPIFDGGKNTKRNCQTLCRGCNLWKTKYVDLPRFQAAKGLEVNPE